MNNNNLISNKLIYNNSTMITNITNKTKTTTNIIKNPKTTYPTLTSKENQQNTLKYPVPTSPTQII